MPSKKQYHFLEKLTVFYCHKFGVISSHYVCARNLIINNGTLYRESNDTKLCLLYYKYDTRDPK
ncbi:hypothetical protein V1477_018437 [Vespula maculifrons]|uniref:Uncharacterized protein n=1 Tax=Vespula maculifrons TaxID=7453 RepID=A0ABD2AVC7_VESMC